MPQDFDQALNALLEANASYARPAYHFLREALEHLQSPQGRSRRRSTQVSAGQLLEQVRIEAIGQFGPMALAVLEDWGIRACDDIGEMVFLLIRHGIVERGRQDRREDFRKGYSFAEAFAGPFVPDSNSQAPACHEPASERVRSGATAWLR